MKTIIALLLIARTVIIQSWVPELGNGRYKNPIIFADYSDPDVIRVEDDFYMVASSFKAAPGTWIGAKVGLFCINPNIEESTGYADFDWFRLSAMND